MSDIARQSREVPLWARTAAQLERGYREGLFTPGHALAAIRDRIDQANPIINAVVAVDWAGAKTAATQSSARWRAGSPLSPSDGIPLTIKDNLYAAGLPATWGSAVYLDFRPGADEPAVARLRNAGAIILGKTNAPEFTLQGYTSNALFGTTHNPHALGRTPGARPAAAPPRSPRAWVRWRSALTAGARFAPRGPLRPVRAQAVDRPDRAQRRLPANPFRLRIDRPPRAERRRSDLDVFDFAGF